MLTLSMLSALVRAHIGAKVKADIRRNHRAGPGRSNVLKIHQRIEKGSRYMLHMGKKQLAKAAARAARVKPADDFLEIPGFLKRKARP